MKEEGVLSTVWWVPWRPQAYVDEFQALVRLARTAPEPEPRIEAERRAARRHLLRGLLWGSAFALLIVIGYVIAK